MKKQLILASMVVCSVMANAQQWTTSGSNIYNSNAGNVSVGGATAPVNKLHVSSAVRGDGIRITQTGIGATGLHFNPSTGDLWSIYALGNDDGWGGAGDLAFQNQTRSVNPFFYIKGNTGNVGIGTTAPGSKLEVSDASNARISAYTQASSSASLWAMNTQNSYGFLVDPSGIGHIVNNINGPVTNVINFASGPKVWIGDVAGAPNSAQLNVNISNNNTNAIDVYDPSATSPSNKVVFRVKNTGTVYAREIFVQVTNFPDYVFSKDYKLMPLSEVEAYIEKNHHLPNVPDASAIQETGLSVGDQSKIQMEKIEELTLYIIELKKELDTLRSQIQD